MRTGANAVAGSTSQPQPALVGVIAASGLAAGVLLSLRLWYARDRLYPRAPLFAGLRIPDSLELALLVLLLLSLFLVVVQRRAAWMRAAVAFTAILVVLDQSRLQRGFTSTRSFC